MKFIWEGPLIRQYKITQGGSNRDNQCRPTEEESSAPGEVARGPENTCLCRHIILSFVRHGVPDVRLTTPGFKNAVCPTKCYPEYWSPR